MLGYSVSYFFAQYWRNVPLYAEKIIPLLDNVLSSNYIYKDKLSEAFYELTAKYQNTAELPIESLKEFIREQGYGYILDLMVQDEENLKLLWYNLILIHQLKGSREGLEVILNLFNENLSYDKINVLTSLTLNPNDSTYTGGFYNNQGISLLTNTLNVSGACPVGSNGSFTYTLPDDKHISDTGLFYLTWTNTSFASLGKLNSIKFIAELENTDDLIIYEDDDIPFTYPSKDYLIAFTRSEGDSPIKALRVEYTCDFYNKKGACLNNIAIKQNGNNLLVDGTISTSSEFFSDYEVDKAFGAYSVANTAPTSDGSITLVYEDSLDAGEYNMSWNLLGADPNKKLDDFTISIRYTDWKASDVTEENSLEILSLEDIPFIYSSKEYNVNFRALKPFNQIYITYTLSDNTSVDTIARFYITDFAIYKRANDVTIRTIPNMTSTTSPKGSVTTDATFQDNYGAFRAFNYTNPLGSIPTSDGYIKYDYENASRPTVGDYVFTWCNGSTDNNNYITSLDAYITYIDGSQQKISSQSGLTALEAKTKYYFKFSASKTIASLTIYYTCSYNNGIGGNISEVNITYTKDVSSGSNITVWHEPLPVTTENTFTVEADVDVAKTGSEFFYNFKNFVQHYVYPELESLKVKYSLEGAQTQRIYNVTHVDYESTLTIPEW